jgi:hypothetical protein
MAVRHRGGQGFDVGRLFDQAEAVAQPLDHGPADEDAAFQHVVGARADAPAQGGEQAVLRGHGLGTGIEHQEAAGSIRVLGHAGLQAGLAEGGGLLVAGQPADGDGRAEQRGGRLAEHAAAVHDLRQQRGGDVEEGQQFGVPALAVDVEEQGAGGIAGIGDVRAPAVSCQTSQLSMVPKASSPAAARVRASGT